MRNCAIVGTIIVAAWIPWIAAALTILNALGARP